MSVQLHFTIVRLVLPAEENWTELAWYGFDSAYVPAAHGEANLAGVPTHDVLEIVLPARRFSAHTLALPAQPGKHLEALIGQAMEDRLLGDRADAFIVPGPQRGSERLVWVCSRRWIESELARLVAAGLQPGKILADYELLPAVLTEASDSSSETSATTAYAQTMRGYLFRTADGRYGAVEAAGDIATLTGGRAARLFPDLYLRPAPKVCSFKLAGPLARFDQRAFDPRSLRRAALMLAMSGALLVLGAVIHWRLLEDRETRLQHEIRQTFATAFPGTPIVDPILQWESMRSGQSAAAKADALDAVVALAARLNASIHPLQLEARDKVVRLTLTDSEVAQFKAQLDDAGNPEASPAETGLTRLQFTLGR